jgi:hypothetical protein
MRKIDLGWGVLVLTDRGAFIVVKSVPYEGKRVSWLTCWRKPKFCGLNLHRPHLTCLYCTLRRSANREIPHVIPVTFVVTPVMKPLKGLKRLFVKKLHSLLEFLCRW